MVSQLFAIGSSATQSPFSFIRSCSSATQSHFSARLSPFSFLISHFFFPLACLLNFDKITLSKFLTSLNTAQKVKKFKTLTSVKKNLRCLTDFFRKQREFFLLKKKNVFLKRKNFLLQRKKILLQRKFSGERAQKKEGSIALLNLYANIHYFSAVSKSAFRAIFTKVNSFAPSFAISELTKRAIFASLILGAKFEMHEKYQSRISCVLNYE